MGAGPVPAPPACPAGARETLRHRSRQRDLSDCSAAAACVQLHGTLLKLHQPLDDRQPKASSVDAGREERLEDAVANLRSNARSTVADGDAADAVVGKNANFDVLVGRRLTGIQGEVQP